MLWCIQLVLESFNSGGRTKVVANNNGVSVVLPTKPGYTTTSNVLPNPLYVLSGDGQIQSFQIKLLNVTDNAPATSLTSYHLSFIFDPSE
jgi:hypothetical protein